MESETGKPLNLPYNVSVEKAFEYKPVRYKLNKSIESLTNYVTKFLDVIVSSHNRFPYVIRFRAAEAVDNTITGCTSEGDSQSRRQFAVHFFL